MATSEIEKLERRYAENPNGLMFAPLAEMYRKNGEIDRALELLAAGIERHPDYIPARIVLGRCHLDRDRIVEAEDAFTRVLALDGENVIALKALADINERLGRFDDAERWLQALLSVDRSNDLAREQLSRVREARRQGGAMAASPDTPTAERALTPDPSLVEPAPETGPKTGPVEVLEIQAAEVETVELDVSEPSAPIEPERAAGELLVIDEPAALTEPVPPLDGVELTEMVVLDEPAPPVAGLVSPDVDAIREELAHGDHFGHVQPDEEFRVETADDLELRPSNASEFQMPDASQDLVAAKPEPDPLAGIPMVDELEPTAAASVEAAVEPAAEPAAAESATEVEAGAVTPPEAAPEFGAEREAESDAPAEPDLIVTETMAEVLVHQGYKADALRIYRELERRDASDARVRAKRLELESELTPTVAPKPRSSFAARDTGGRSVGALFRDLLGARLDAARPPLPPAPSSGPSDAPSTTGAPTRPAADSLSLSAVFGEDNSPVPPAVPAVPKGHLSFDEFFGARGAAAPAPGPRAPASQDDDLDQFNAWLQNLKR